MMNSFPCKSGEIVEVYKLSSCDFPLVWNFYQREIALLENVADFYPYKESELSGILEGVGIFIGGFIGGELCAVCGIDYDSSYQDAIKRVNEIHPNFPIRDNLLEFSGLFVGEKFRALGIAGKMTGILLDFARENLVKTRLFAVVLESNVASMKNFFAHGFKLFGWWKMDETFKFSYLISPKKDEKLIEASNLEKVSVASISEKLKLGYVFSGVTENGELIGAKIS